jgi:hypothetical protein
MRGHKEAFRLPSRTPGVGRYFRAFPRSSSASGTRCGITTTALVRCSAPQIPSQIPKPRRGKNEAVLSLPCVIVCLRSRNQIGKRPPFHRALCRIVIGHAPIEESSLGWQNSPNPPANALNVSDFDAGHRTESFLQLLREYLARTKDENLIE